MTNKQFKALERYSNGDVVDLQMNCITLNNSQIEMLTGDDQSRYFENQEELAYMMSDLEAEFG